MSPCHHGMESARVTNRETNSRYERYLKIHLKNQWRTADKGWSSGFGAGRGAENSQPKNLTMPSTSHKNLGDGLILSEET